MEIHINTDAYSTPSDLRAASAMLATLASARDAALADSSGPGIVATAEEHLATGQDVTASGETHGALSGGEVNTSNLSKEPGEDDAKKLDEKGVEFNDDYCGHSEVPFYTSARVAGQWKKRRGVSQADYDTWYAEALAAVDVVVSASSTEGTTQEQVDTAAAFSSAATAGPTSNEVPKDVGALMAWVSEHQVSGHLTPPRVAAAYASAQIQPQDLFPSEANTPGVVEQRIGTLFGFLQAQASA